jgi:hypothetical protein
MPPPPELISLARTIAVQHSLDPALVCAVVEQESAWDAHAIRYEPAFRTRYVAPLGLPPTEEVARSISWGLMQVMGQVAREHAFTGKFLSALCDPAAGLDVGCSVLVSKFATAAAEAAAANPSAASPTAPPPSAAAAHAAIESLTSRALELWNGGGNPNYASEVLARITKYQ